MFYEFDPLDVKHNPNPLIHKNMCGISQLWNFSQEELNFGLMWFQDTLQLLICVLLLSDLSVTLLILVEFYWISLGAFLAVLLILPLSLLSPFPAGLNALFSRGHRRASLARIYALWNATSLSNVVSFILILLALLKCSQAQFILGYKLCVIGFIYIDFIQAVAFTCGMIHYGFLSFQMYNEPNTWENRR